MKVIYKKQLEDQDLEGFDFDKEMKNLMNKLFSNSNPASQLENMLKYGFNFGNQSISGINDLLKQIRKKKLEEMRKNLSGTHEEEKNKIDKVKDTEMSDVMTKIPQQVSELEEKLSSSDVDKQGIEERIDELLKELSERKEMLSDVSSKNFNQAIQQFKEYDSSKGFMSEEAKQLFEELLKNFQDINRLGEFLRKHPYGFKEGEPLNLQEAIDTIDRFEKLEELEEKLKKGEIYDIPPELIKELLDNEEYKSFSTLHKILEVLKNSGFFVMRGNSVILTPRGVRKIGEKVLKDIFVSVRKERFIGSHSSKKKGNYELDYEDRKKWEFGDNINIDIFSSLKNAIMNKRFDMETGKIELSPDDFEIFKMKHFSRVSSALLIDTSWSMSWGGKFECAKKVAIALHSLISSFFPKDTLYIIGFFTVAMEIKPSELPSIELNMNDPFTNMQDALRLARKLLKRHPAEEKEIIMITDGQPTAYCVGSRVFVEWPIMGCSPNAMRETMKEVEEATKENITINIFMVEDNPQVQKFVEEVVRINKGRAFFTTPENLGKYVLLDFVQRRKKLIR
ncbi:hypothetical protein HRbin19_00672 [bacterium HR19]|nr:hypothetical protein HRbin19_00672 [bacterium HR19]